MADRDLQALAARMRFSGRRRSVFGFGRPSSFTVIDLDGQTLRVAQSSRQGAGSTISELAATRLDCPFESPDFDPEASGKSVARALEHLKIKPGPVVMAAPRSQVFLRTLILPMAGTTEELAAMVQFQISKDLPFRIEDAVVDFTVLRFLASSGACEESSIRSRRGKEAEGIVNTENPPPHLGGYKVHSPNACHNEMAASQEATPPPTPGGEPVTGAPSETALAAAAAQVEVLVAVMKKEAVARYERLAAAAGFKLRALGLRSCANARCLGVRHAPDGQRAVALVSMRSDEVTIECVIDQSVVFSRAASADRHDDAASGGADSTRESKPGLEPSTTPAMTPPTQGSTGFIQAITTEVMRSLHSYESSVGNSPVEKILITGGTGNEAVLVAALSQRQRLPCELFTPSPAFGMEARDKQGGAESLAILGLACGVHDLEGLPLDFLNPKRPPIPRNWRRIKLLAAASAGVTLLVALAGLRSHLISRGVQAKDQVQTQVTQAEKNRPLFRDMRLKARTVRDWTEEKRNWLDHYALLSTLLPPSQDVYLTSISTGARGVIHLSVQARAGEILAQMDKRLREAGYEVKPLAITPGTDKHGYPFRSSVELTLSAKMKKGQP